MTLPPINTQEPSPDPSRQALAKAYARSRRYFSIGDTALGGAILLILIVWGLSARLVSLISVPGIAGAVLYFVALLIGYTVLSAPLSYCSGFVLSHHYGISTQRLSGWLADRAKGLLLSMVLGAGLVALVYWLLAILPEIWWLASWAVVIVLSLIITILAPLVLVPLFFKMKPIEDADLKARLEKLTLRVNFNASGIYIIGLGAKMTAANAALMGTGRTRRIVISDTMLSAYSPAEIEVITAHELGHHNHHDTLRLFIFQGALQFIIFDIVSIVYRVSVSPLGFTSISDAAALPLLILTTGVLSLLASPLTNSFTRYVESGADGFALHLTDNPEAFVSAMTRLTDQNLSVAEPARWEEALLYDHPSYNQRVAHARAYMAQKRAHSSQ